MEANIIFFHNLRGHTLENEMPVIVSCVVLRPMEHLAGVVPIFVTA